MPGLAEGSVKVERKKKSSQEITMMIFVYYMRLCVQWYASGYSIVDVYIIYVWIYILVHIQHCARYMQTVNFYDLMCYYYYPDFTDEKSEAPRSWVTCPRLLYVEMKTQASCPLRPLLPALLPFHKRAISVERVKHEEGLSWGM